MDGVLTEQAVQLVAFASFMKNSFLCVECGQGGMGRVLYIHSRVQIQSCLKFCRILMIIVNPSIRTVLLFLKSSQSIILIPCTLSAKHL